MNKSDLIALRAYKPEDESFLYSTFLKGLYYGDSWFRLIEKDVFMKNYHRIISALLASPNTTVKIACLKEDHDTIVGYSIMNVNQKTLHYVFTKPVWRTIGVAKMLVPVTVETVTHMTKVGLGIIKKHPNLKFNPFSM